MPPRREPAPEVPYPEGAEGDARVVLVLVVERDGSVRSVQVDRGEPPFSEVARRAAKGWRFQPARRGGVAIAARIRFIVEFRAPARAEPPADPPPADEPQPATASAKPVTSAAAKPAAVPAPSGPIEVVVHGDARDQAPPPSVSTLSRTEVRQMPGAFGDPFRAIEALPGVTPIISGLPFFYVRGAPPGNVGYFLDGVRVPYLYHVAIGPSVIHPAMVDHVDLYAGGYPAQYGRFAGAIVAAETTAPRVDWHGEGNVRVFDAGALVEGGFAGDKGTALLGARYSYTAAIISLLAPDVTLDYRDYQARLTYDVGSRDTLSAFAFGSYDLLAENQNDIQSILFGSEFYRVDARWDHKLGSDGNLRWAATWGYDQTRVAEQRNAQDLLLGTRVEFVQPLDAEVTLRAGADFQSDSYRADARQWADPDDPDVKQYNSLFPVRVDTALGARADVVWKATRRVQVTPGLRLDMYRSGDASALAADPRVALRVDVTDHVRLLHAFGIAHQPPSFVVPIPGLAVGNLQGGLQTSAQLASGVEVELPDVATATLTAFNDIFFDMSDTLGVSQRGSGRGLAEQRSLGSSYGLELYVRRRLTRRLGGFLSYTLSRSTRSVGRETFPAAFDRTHVASAALAFDLGRRWRAGTRFSIYTGAPVYPSAPNGTTPPLRSSNPDRDPFFYRIDLRLEKRWNLGKSTWISFVMEMLNATLHKEVVRGEEIGPIAIPSLGAEGGF